MKVNIYSAKTLIYFNFKLSLNLGKEIIIIYYLLGLCLKILTMKHSFFSFYPAVKSINIV